MNPRSRIHRPFGVFPVHGATRRQDTNSRSAKFSLVPKLTENLYHTLRYTATRQLSELYRAIKQHRSGCVSMQDFSTRSEDPSMRYYTVWLDSRLLFILVVLLVGHKSETWYLCKINQGNGLIKLVLL